MTLYIIGFSRCGKSTFARSLAESWQVPAFDTDAVFEHTYGESILDYTTKHGWKAFRNIESQILRKLGAQCPQLFFSQKIQQIVACGGGIVESAENRIFLKSQKTLWLHCPWQVIEQRLLAEPSAISHGKSRSEMLALYHARLPLYKEVICK